MAEWKIAYTDGSTQTVKADTHRAEGDWVVFRNGADVVLRIRDDDVSSVSRSDVPDRVTPGPMFA